ncbi:hypothetical protein V8E53_009083 [Lactarius tabidus]
MRASLLQVASLVLVAACAVTPVLPATILLTLAASLLRMRIAPRFPMIFKLVVVLETAGDCGISVRRPAVLLGDGHSRIEFMASSANREVFRAFLDRPEHLEHPQTLPVVTDEYILH